MATKKGLCPYCKTQRLDRRIFPVNPEASTCFCPTCMKEMEPQLAIDGYKSLIENLLSEADKTLFVTCDPILAYQQYADIIEIEAKETHALLGRILCLIYMGKVRKSLIKEASTLLETVTYDITNIVDYVFFLKKIDFALNEYDEALLKKLTFKGYYFDVDCYKTYLVHLYEVIKMKELILDIFKEIKKKYSSQQNIETIEEIERNIDEKKRILHLESYLANGMSFQYTKMTNGKACVENTNHDIETHLYRYRLSTLNENDKKNRYITDEVFKDYTKVAHAKVVSLVFAIFAFVIALGFGGLAAWFNKDVIYFYSFIASGGASLIISLILLILHLRWKRILNKRKLRID